MAKLPPWDDLRSGEGCPLCELKDEHTSSLFFIRSLSASYLYLNKNQAYRGTCVLVFNRHHATRPSELASDEWQSLANDIRMVEMAITATVNPDHINLEMLGNSVPHLHAYLFPRVKSDPRWGHPIWMTERSAMQRERLAEGEYEEMAKSINDVITKSS